MCGALSRGPQLEASVGMDTFAKDIIEGLESASRRVAAAHGQFRGLKGAMTTALLAD